MYANCKRCGVIIDADTTLCRPCKQSTDSVTNKTYIGDGVYAQNLAGTVVLTAEDGISVSATIYLDAQTLNTFLLWIQKQPQAVTNNS